MKETKSEEEIKTLKEKRKEEAKKLKQERKKEFAEAEKRRKRQSEAAEETAIKLGKKKEYLQSLLLNVRWSFRCFNLYNCNALHESSNTFK